MRATTGYRDSGRDVVVFDLDGTLIDTRAEIAAAVNHVRGLRSLAPLTVAAVLAEVGRGAAHLVSRTAGAPAADELPELLAEFRRYYREHQGTRSAPYPGIREAVAALGVDRDLYVLSNKPHEATVREIELQGLTGAFRAVWGAGNLFALKPNPAGVLEALRLSGSGAARGAMVGDSAIDVATAIAAGVTPFLATWGFGPAAGAPGGTVVAVGSPARLVEEIRRALPPRR